MLYEMLCSYIKDKLYENVDKVQEMLVVYYTIDKLTSGETMNLFNELFPGELAEVASPHLSCSATNHPDAVICICRHGEIVVVGIECGRIVVTLVFIPV